MRLKDQSAQSQVGRCDRPTGSSQMSSSDPTREQSVPTLSQTMTILDYSHDVDPLVRLFATDLCDPENPFIPENSMNTYIQLSQESVHNNTDPQLSQTSDSPMGHDFAPDQGYIQTLDTELTNLSRDVYISRLKELTHDNENTISWYRTILLSRARSVQGCPLGELITRKSTVTSSSATKYARDCCTIQAFLLGNPSGIDDIFKLDSKNKSKTSVVSESVSTNCSIIELRTTLQNALGRLVELERNDKIHTKEIESLKKSNQKLRDDLKESVDKFETLQASYDRKCAQYDSNFKLFKQKSKAIGEFEYDEYLKNVERFDKEATRQSQLISNIKKNVSELKLQSQRSYANVTQQEPRYPIEVNTIESRIVVSSKNVQPPVQSTANGVPVRENLSNDKPIVSTTERDSHKLKNVTQPNDMKSSNAPENTHVVPDGPTRNNSWSNELPTESSEMSGANERHFNIPVRVQGHTAETECTDNNFFSGVKKRKSARFYLSGIESRSTRQGIIEYCEKNKVKVTYCRIFSPRNRQRFLTAKINVTEECAYKLESSDFWPAGVSCREWLNDREWQQKFTDEHDRDQHNIQS